MTAAPPQRGSATKKKCDKKPLFRYRFPCVKMFAYAFGTMLKKQTVKTEPPIIYPTERYPTHPTYPTTRPSPANGVWAIPEGSPDPGYHPVLGWMDRRDRSNINKSCMGYMRTTVAFESHCPWGRFPASASEKLGAGSNFCLGSDYRDSTLASFNVFGTRN